MATPQEDDLAAMEAERAAASHAIVESSARAKLIVAGPGTGKTFTFREALNVAGGRGLALTFIRNLAADLETALSEFAEVYTFHGFCKRQMHIQPPPGLSRPDYYPPVLELLAEDLRLLGDDLVTSAGLERALHEVDEALDLIPRLLSAGNYYDAVGHTDVVYRVLKQFEENPDEVPVYPLVVVDEYQDFNRLETRFIEALAGASATLIAGDDDQALYSFKHATADYIRELAEAGSPYARFELPYCSRCTAVVVEAVNAVIKTALDRGNLLDRLDKPYRCYLPEKLERSAAYPRIIDARCSVDTAVAPYIGRYIAQQISAIPGDEVAESIEGGFPTVLVVGPNPFLSRAHAEIIKTYPAAELRVSARSEIEPLDGYVRLLENDRAQLGWRILIACFPTDAGHSAIVRGQREDLGLRALLAAEWVEGHLAVVAVLARLKDGETLDEREEHLLRDQTGRNIIEICERLGLLENDEEASATQAEGTADAPTVVCTSLVGAKGLSAQHVFVVGLNGGHFPRDQSNISDDEVCQFLVALSRTRSCCHLISTGRLGAETLMRSRFLDWVSAQAVRRTVNAAYFK